MGAAIGILMLLVFGAVAFAMWWYSEAQVTLRALRGTPPVAIAQFAAGGVHKIVGRISVADGMLEAPLSGRMCAVYEVVVEERRSSGKSTHWSTIIHHVEAVPFLVTDSTGTAQVLPEHAELKITRDAHSRSGTFDDASPREERFLAAHGERSEGWVFNRGLRYREGVLEVGETVAVRGAGVPVDDPATPGTQILQLSTGGLERLYISDDPSVQS